MSGHRFASGCRSRAAVICGCGAVNYSLVVLGHAVCIKLNARWNFELGYRRMSLESDILDALDSALEDDLGHHLLGYLFIDGLGRVEVAVDIFVFIGDYLLAVHALDGDLCLVNIEVGASLCDCVERDLDGLGALLVLNTQDVYLHTVGELRIERGIGLVILAERDACAGNCIFDSAGGYLDIV